MEISEQIKQEIIRAVKDGKVAKGALEVIRSIQKKKAKIVIGATDVDLNEVNQKIKQLCRISGIPFINLFSKEELGKIAGINVSTSFLSIITAGKNSNKLIEIILKLSSKEYLDYLEIDKNQSEARERFLEQNGIHFPNLLVGINKVVWEKQMDGSWKTFYYAEIVAKAKANEEE